MTRAQRQSNTCPITSSGFGVTPGLTRRSIHNPTSARMPEDWRDLPYSSIGERKSSEFFIGRRRRGLGCVDWQVDQRT